MSETTPQLVWLIALGENTLLSVFHQTGNELVTALIVSAKNPLVFVSPQKWSDGHRGYGAQVILCLCPAKERRRYFVTTSLSLAGRKPRVRPVVYSSFERHGIKNNRQLHRLFRLNTKKIVKHLQNWSFCEGNPGCARKLYIKGYNQTSPNILFNSTYSTS